MATCAVLMMSLSSCQSGDPGDPGGPAPLEPPPNFRVEAAAEWGHCKLTWSPPPGTVDAYEVSASVSDWTFPDREDEGRLVPGDATQAELRFIRYVTEFTQIDIKIRSLRGDQVSEFSPAGDCTLPLRPPSDPVTMLESTGIRVQWTNQSELATTIEIEKAELDASGAPGVWSALTMEPAKDEPFFSTYIDTAVTVGTAYGYRVTAVAGAHRSAGTQMTSIAIGSPLATTTIQLPLAPAFASDGKGHYAFSGFRSAIPFLQPLRFAWGNGTTWTTATEIHAAPFAPFVKLDAAGLPHTVYGKPSASGTGVVITHGWSDGTQWLEETIAERTLYWSSRTPSLLFDLDAAGIPAMVWSVDERRFEAAIKTGAAWTVTPLDSLVPIDGSFTGYNVFTDQAGTLHLLISTVKTIAHLEPKSGIWTREMLPLTVEQFFAGDTPLVGAGRDPDHLTICFLMRSASFWADQGGCLRKSPTGWGKLEPLGSTQGSVVISGWLTLSPDGARLGALYHGEVARVYRSDVGGSWTEVIVNPKLDTLGRRRDPAIGFDAGGKFFALSGGGDFSGTAVLGDYQLEREP